MSHGRRLRDRELQVEKAYCKDFMCCGREIADLHELLQHFEEDHVSMLDDIEETGDYLGIYEQDSDLLVGTVEQYHSVVDSCIPLSVTDMSRLWKQPFPWNDDSPPSSPSLSSGGDSSSSSSKQSSPALKPHRLVPIFHRPDDSQWSLELVDQDYGWLVKAATDAIDFEDCDSKPYKCPVEGCAKAYKNANGLKYHKLHGHCADNSDAAERNAKKPYQCSVGSCRKRYKNLNGLKYHIEHTHMAKLRRRACS